MFRRKEYIWVEGYKGTDENMVCHGYGTAQKYCLNKEIKFDGEPKLCEKGFHFCFDLYSVFSYYRYDFKNRYFKVKAFVPKDVYDNCIAKGWDKCVARSIILTEEVFPTYEMLRKKYGITDRDMDERMFNDIKSGKFSSKAEAWHNRITEELKSLDYPQSLIDYVTEYGNIYQYKEAIELAKGLAGSGVRPAYAAPVIVRVVKEIPF